MRIVDLTTGWSVNQDLASSDEFQPTTGKRYVKIHVFSLVCVCTLNFMLI